MKKNKDIPKYSKPSDITKEFGLCRDSEKSRNKEDGLLFFKQQLEQAKINNDTVQINNLTAIINKLDKGNKNGLRIQPERIGKKSKR